LAATYSNRQGDPVAGQARQPTSTSQVASVSVEFLQRRPVRIPAQCA